MLHDPEQLPLPEPQYVDISLSQDRQFGVFI